MGAPHLRLRTGQALGVVIPSEGRCGPPWLKVEGPAVEHFALMVG